MATYGNTGGSGLNINVYSGSGGNLNEWALDYDGLKLLTIPEVITASNITTNQSVTVTLKAKPIFNNISVSFFRVKLPDGVIQEYPAINNTAIFTTPIAGALGSQQTLLVYARDNSGNRSAVASHLYTVVNSLPPSVSNITHNIPSSFSAGDVKQIQISGAVDPEGDPYTYSLILSPEISGSKISGIANNETVTLTVQNTIEYTKKDNIVIRVTDINGAQDDKVLDITLLSGGSSGGTNNFNVRTSFPSSVYPNEVFTAKIWELGTNNYTYGLNLPSGVTASKTMGILSNENFTVTIAPNVAPNSTIGIDVVVYTGNVSVGSFVVNMLVDGVTGETSYTTPGSYEFTVPNTVNSLSMLEVYSDNLLSQTVNSAGFDIHNLMDKNIVSKTVASFGQPDIHHHQQLNNIIFTVKAGGILKYTNDNFDTMNVYQLSNNFVPYLSKYGNGSYIITGTNGISNADTTWLSVNNGATWTPVPSAAIGLNTTSLSPHMNLDFSNSTFYIIENTPTADNLISTDGGYTFVRKPLPFYYQTGAHSKYGVLAIGNAYYRTVYNINGDNKLRLLKTTDRCNTWSEVVIPQSLNIIGEAVFKFVNNVYILILRINDTSYKIMWSMDLISWSSHIEDFGYSNPVPTLGTEIFYLDGEYFLSSDMNNKPFYIFNTNTSVFRRSNMSNIFSKTVQIDKDYLLGHVIYNPGNPDRYIKIWMSNDDYITIDAVSGSAYIYYTNNEIVCLINEGDDKIDVKRIKYTCALDTNAEIMYLTNDFSDKNVVNSHVVPGMSFGSVVSSGNNLLAINRQNNKVYKNLAGSKIWEVIPEITMSSFAAINMHVYGNSVIVNDPDNGKMFYSANNGNTWKTFSTSGYTYSILYKGKIYSTKLENGYDYLFNCYEFNINNSTETLLAPGHGGLLYELNNVLIRADAAGQSDSYLDENYLETSYAFKSIIGINSNYRNKFPNNNRSDAWVLRNYSTKYIIGNHDSDSVSIFNNSVKNITLNDIINNQNSTLNVLTTNVIRATDGLVPNPLSNMAQLRVYDDFIIFINIFVISISVDGGLTYTSININADIHDVVVNNGIIYIFSGNIVKKIVPSILDNSNIINKEPNIGYSLTNPKLAGNFGKNGYAKYLNNIEVTPGDKLNINVTSPDGGVRLVWGTNRFFPTNAS